VPIDKPLGFFDCFGIVRAGQRLNSNEMPVETDGVSAIISHPESPHCQRCSDGFAPLTLHSQQDTFESLIFLLMLIYLDVYSLVKHRGARAAKSRRRG
jgi:hypothetical protein